MNLDYHKILPKSEYIQDGYYLFNINIPKTDYISEIKIDNIDSIAFIEVNGIKLNKFNNLKITGICDIKIIYSYKFLEKFAKIKIANVLDTTLNMNNYYPEIIIPYEEYKKK